MERFEALKRLARRAFRYAARLTLRRLLGLTTRLQIEGLDNIPQGAAAIIAFNHLGHLDPLLVSAFSPRAPEFITLADLLSVPVIAAVGGILFLGEAITLRLLIASIAILGGVALVIFDKQSIA